MPRKTRSNPFALPPRKTFTSSVIPLLNAELPDQAYRLYQILVALSWQHGFVECYNAELGIYLNTNREKVRRLLGKLIGMNLVTAITLTDGRQRLTPADSGDLASALQPSRLIEPEVQTYQNSEGEKPSSESPHNGKPPVTNSCRYPSQIHDDTIDHDDDSINDLKDKESSSNEVSSQIYDDTSPPSQICDDTEPKLLWQRYFGGNNGGINANEVIDRLLADPDLRQAAITGGETARDWLIAAIDKTAAYQPKKPLPYFQKIISTRLAEARAMAGEPSPVEALALPPPDKQAELWADVLNVLRLQMTKATFDTCLKDTTLISADDGVWTVEVENNYTKEWLETRLKNHMARALKQFVDGPVELKFIERGE